ncbi:protein of unknown function [Tenacibaculum litopenaei]|uniref:hypothetical protein n=1 Tax=Tenacibaculum litopenaei TaxID=396016 RepID=UPI0038943DAB
MEQFIVSNWHIILPVISAIFSYLVGLKSKRIKLRESEYLAKQKMLETYQLEFNIKDEMLEKLKKDYISQENRFLKSLELVEQQNKRLAQIIEKQKKVIENYEKKYGNIQVS